jgi:peptide/nickel transport system substrate-binding protein
MTDRRHLRRSGRSTDGEAMMQQFDLLAGRALPAIALVIAVACSPAAPATNSPEKAEPTPTQAVAKAVPTTAPAAPTAAPAPKAPAVSTVNRVVMGVVPPFVEGNELRHIDQTDVWQLRPMYEYLIGMDAETGKPIPMLATEWSLEDGPSYRFKLRRGAQFHGSNGEFTAQDVVFSWKDLTQETSTNGQAPNWRSVVRDIEVVNDYEVVFHLSRPDANFIRAISEAEGAMEIRSSRDASALGSITLDTRPVAGTGPYQFKERVQGQYIRFERVPYQHWRVTSDFPEFEFRFMKEASTRMAALLAGEIHVTTLPQDLLVDAQQRGYPVIRGRVASLRAFGTMLCCFLNDPKDFSTGMMYPDSPLMDVRVRQALNKAINRDELNKALFGGKGEPMILNHFHPSRPGWKPEWENRFQEAYGYDPARARALLAEAGQSGLTTNMLVLPTPAFAGAEDVAEAIAAYWRAVGVNVQLQQIDLAEARTLAQQKKLSNHTQIVGTSAGQLIGMVYNSSRGWLGPQDPETDQLVSEIYETLDPAKQEALWQKLGDQFFDKQMSIPMFWLPAEAVVNPRVIGDYVWPGAITGTWTHVQNLKAAR